MAKSSPSSSPKGNTSSKPQPRLRTDGECDGCENPTCDPYALARAETVSPPGQPQPGLSEAAKKQQGIEITTRTSGTIKR